MRMDRRRWLQSAALAAGALGAGAAAAQAAPARVAVASTGQGRTDYGPALERLSRYAELHLETFGLPGMTLAVADGEGFRATITAGFADLESRTPVTPDQLFQIGSISKSFTALGVLELADRGKIDLDAPAADLLPEAPLPKEPRFTVKHLLNHTSGLPDDAPLFPRGTDGLWCGFEPGSRMSYSNLGYGLLGLLIERATGRSYDETVREHILEPLGMKDTRPLIRDGDRKLHATGYSPYYRDRPYVRRDPISDGPWTPFAEASGSVASTPADMARYIAFLIGAGQGRGAPVLSDEGARRFSTPTTEAPPFGAGAHYASGIAVVPLNGRQLLHHTGGMLTFSSSIHVDSKAGVGAFASTNVRVAPDYRPRLVTAYACTLLAAARAGQPLPAAADLTAAAPAEPGDATPAPLVSAAGETIALEAAGGAMVLRWNGQAIELERSGKDAYLVRHPRFAVLPLKLNRNGGRVVSAWWGPVLFAADPAERTPPPAPAELQKLAGRYDNDAPWSPGVTRVVARADGLSLDGVMPLVRLPDGSWRIGPEEGSPERLRFDAVLNGRAQRLNFSGVDLVRTGEVTDG